MRICIIIIFDSVSTICKIGKIGRSSPLKKLEFWRLWIMKLCEKIWDMTLYCIYIAIFMYDCFVCLWTFINALVVNSINPISAEVRRFVRVFISFNMYSEVTI